MTASDTYLGLRAFVDELARCGLREACTSPGSRSTPLVLSLAREPRIRATSHLDERSAGFFALGIAKSSGVPAALACTSGTAAANYAPAVIEAHEARVPLLVLTADRPPELRQLGAGQTIDQVKLFGSAVKWFFEVDSQAAAPERLRWLRQLACRAFWTAVDGRPGPVHLNFALREPLVLDAPLPEDDGGRAGGRPWVTRPRVAGEPPPALLDGLRNELEARPHAVLVAGRAERDRALGPALAAFAERAAIPLLADPLSGARRGPAAVAHYDALLRDPEWADGERPAARAAGRRPADLEAAARVAARTRTTRSRSPSTPRRPGRTRPAPSPPCSPPTRASRWRRSPAGCRGSATRPGSSAGTAPIAPPRRASPARSRPRA